MEAAKAMTVVASRHTNDRFKEYPGDQYKVEFLITFGTLTTSDNITAPYDIVFNLQETTSTPIKYEDYTWISGCKNTQFGPDATETVPLKLMSKVNPPCTIKGQKLTIHILNSTDSLVTSD
jgi:hypothetical protein